MRVKESTETTFENQSDNPPESKNRKHIETVEIMKQDDIADNPESEFEEFQCDCCAKIVPVAGSMIYGDKHFCNDCVLYAEVAC